MVSRMTTVRVGRKRRNQDPTHIMEGRNALREPVFGTVDIVIEDQGCGCGF